MLRNIVSLYFHSKPIGTLVVVWTVMVAIMLNGCANVNERSTFKMKNLNISVLRDRNIPINLVQYRNLYEDDPTREEEWKLLIFDEKVGFKKGDIVLVAQDFYLVDGDMLISICPVSDQQTTNKRVIPYLRATIDRAALLE